MEHDFCCQDSYSKFWLTILCVEFISVQSNRPPRTSSLPPPRDRYRKDEEGARGRNSDRDYYRPRDREYDDRRYDDRKRRRYNRREGPPDRSPRKIKDWPTPFEESGSTYVFDARSGFFYEGDSDFFYDPKTKLYYSNPKKLYYRFMKDEKDSSSPPFKEVSKEEHDVEESGLANAAAAAAAGSGSGSMDLTSVDAGQDLVLQALQGGAAATGNESKKTEKKKISICLTKATQKKAAAAAESFSNSNKNAVSKEAVNLELKPRNVHNADIEKWDALAKKTVLDEEGKSTKIRRTKNGNPICIICRRKFENEEKLRQHEELSALHKHYLEKRKKMISKAKENDYRDRATERRKMYEPDSDAKCAIAPPMDVSMVAEAPSLTKARTVAATEDVAPSQMLGETNIGNKML